LGACVATLEPNARHDSAAVSTKREMPRMAFKRV
jgi:hypothetical protein